MRMRFLKSLKSQVGVGLLFSLWTIDRELLHNGNCKKWRIIVHEFFNSKPFKKWPTTACKLNKLHNYWRLWPIVMPHNNSNQSRKKKIKRVYLAISNQEVKMSLVILWMICRQSFRR